MTDRDTQPTDTESSEPSDGLLPVERRTYMTFFAASAALGTEVTAASAGTAASGGDTATATGGGGVAPMSSHGYGQGRYGEGPYGGGEMDEGPPALRDSWDPPQDPDGDGFYEDINGDGDFNIFDVQALFNELDNPIVDDYAESFNFDENDPPEVGIFDVQALFNELSESDE